MGAGYYDPDRAFASIGRMIVPQPDGQGNPGRLAIGPGTGSEARGERPTEEVWAALERPEGRRRWLSDDPSNAQPEECQDGRVANRGTENLAAVLTGASSVMGSAIAERLAQDGFGLVLLGRDPVRLDRVRQRAREAGAPWAEIQVQDLRRPLADETRETLKRHRPTALVHIAGVAYADRWDHTTPDELRQMFDVHVTALGGCLRAVRSSLRENHGSVVAIASIDAGSVPLIEPAAGYAATKAALTAYARNLAAELGPEGIRVNVVWPGAIASGMGASLADAKAGGRGSERSRRLLGAIPLGRFGTPQDIAGAVRFLVSPESAYITGAVLVVDGGLTLGYGAAGPTPSAATGET